MSLYWQSLNPMHQFRGEVDRLLSGFLSNLTDGNGIGAVRGQPAVNMWDTADSVFVELEVPGLKTDQLDLSVVGDQLSIRVERPDAAQDGMTYHRRERPVGSFTRVLQLPVEVEADKVQADLNDGVLTIRLPKAEAAKPRKIQVTTAK
ncbi:MAG: Hsp20/alpha crystallin family protein [Thermoguttaceae bacterium]|jgi:HSP20 family protein